MWVKGTLLHFIVDSGSQKNLISAEVVKQFGLSTTPHHNHTTLGGFTKDEIFMSANNVDWHMTSNPSRMRYYVIIPHWMSMMFSSSYMCHVVYESRPRSVIVSLGGHLYRIPEVVPTTVPPKQCRKLVSYTTKFIFFTICSKGEQKDTATTTSSAQAPSIQQKQVENITAKCKYSFCTQASHVARLVKKIQPFQPQVRDNLQQAKQCNFSTKASSSSRCRFNKHFSISLGHSMQWRPFTLYFYSCCTFLLINRKLCITVSLCLWLCL
jgi:hypothetical protein